MEELQKEIYKEQKCNEANEMLSKISEVWWNVRDLAVKYDPISNDPVVQAILEKIESLEKPFRDILEKCKVK